MSERDFYLFAGINGAGKSTLFSTVTENIKNTFRINTDEIVKKFSNWRNELIWQCGYLWQHKEI